MIRLSDITTTKERDVIEEILRNYRQENGNIISLLQDIQSHYKFLPSFVLNIVSQELKIPLSKIYSVATFYTQFSFNEKGKYVITVCDGTACHVKGGPLLADYIKTKLGIKSGETTKDKIVSLEVVSCVGACALSPVALVNDKVHGSLTVRKLNKLLSQIRKSEYSKEDSK